MALTSTFSVVVPTAKPTDAFVVPKDFVGFGIESAFLNNFANDFSENLVSALAGRMTLPPFLRVGGTGGDYFQFDPNLAAEKACVSGSCGSSTATYLLGPSFFNGYKRFKDAMMIIQAPLNNPINTTNTVDFVYQAWKALDNGARVASIALGNEVEFIYPGGAARYTSAALSLQSAIVANLSLSGTAARIFQAGNTASGTVKNGAYYSVQDILAAGIANNGLIKSTAEHYYQIMDTPDWTDANMQSLVLNHTAITERFNLFIPDITASRNLNIPFVMAEDAAVLGGAPIEFSGGFGYTLWAVDFNLAAMARKINRVANLCGAPTSRRVFWNPDSTGGTNSPGPQVRAPFPAAMFVADFIGSETNAAVTEINLGTGIPLLSAYAMYDGSTSKLLRVALVNMRIYNATNAALVGNTRGSVTFNLSLGTAVKSAVVRSLHADKGVAAMGYDFGGPTSNVSWAGEQWSYSIDQGKGHYTTGAAQQTTMTVTNGVLSLTVPNSEAVIVTVN
ncbi:hypothetical protein GQ53DRAFT_827864 [Thozetella sp. PMI_491]|nr:hypothetical protein GQ53DRAFT_827864 [Thozetella sp. PMI_491]